MTKPRFARVFEGGRWKWACFSFGVRNGALRYAWGHADTIDGAYAHWWRQADSMGLRP